MQTIQTISRRLSREDATALVEQWPGDFRVNRCDPVWFPYAWFQVDCSLRTLWRQQQIKLQCLVNLCDGVAATCDPLRIERLAVEDKVVESAMAMSAAALRALRYSAHAVVHKKRTLQYVKPVITEQNRVFKPLWVVAGTYGKEDIELEVLVDGITGGYHLLTA
ncbi:hypothetical protein GCM10011502_00770 [Oceanisphaera marina]|uniref:Uncharacterized protein n=1 Tax=Oceanisphaera marina TaxID=2017550 RepID=A0ABQ1ID49_9GAMM|nr:hypothetical protein [Oceanisphaera marina]GGB31641.1 hypothetical protein GCM10011502_00770 [Oceanisphaera marina]